EFRRVDERTFPLRRLAKRTVRAAALQFLHERAHPLLQHAGALLRAGCTAGFLGQLLVVQRERDVIRDPPRKLHIIVAVRGGPVRPKRDPSDRLILDAHWHAQQRADSHIREQARPRWTRTKLHERRLGRIRWRHLGATTPSSRTAQSYAINERQLGPIVSPSFVKR